MAFDNQFDKNSGFFLTQIIGSNSEISDAEDLKKIKIHFPIKRKGRCQGRTMGELSEASRQ